MSASLFMVEPPQKPSRLFWDAVPGTMLAFEGLGGQNGQVVPEAGHAFAETVELQGGLLEDSCH